MKQLTFRLKPGQFLKEEIERRAKEDHVRAGVLLSLVGSLESVSFRMAGAIFGNQVVKKLEGPFEVVSGTGTISERGCHIHASVSDKEGKVIGGHLKDGSKIATTAEIVIGVFDDVSYKRVLDEETGFEELKVDYFFE